IPVVDVTQSAKSRETGPARLVVTLSLAGLLSGLAIIGIYEATLPTITANKLREMQAAVFTVVPGITQMQKLAYRDGMLHGVEQNAPAEFAIYGGYDNEGRFVGYAIPAEGKGFQDTISILYGYKPDTNRVTGMAVLDSRETPGLGDKIFKDAHFVAEFNNLSVEPEIQLVKKGKKTGQNQVDAITGATISSKAVVNIINASNQFWFERMPAGGSEPAMDSRPKDAAQ
ncbi:MAG: FMN-binding protein, partial [Gammaproteobacteria bacterium]|nr:FMN-binding protein [Gammaproteobacteria bacterium]